MHFYTTTERRDDPRVAAFVQFAKQAGATNITVVTRPEHISPDLATLQQVSAAYVTRLDAASQAGHALDLVEAARLKAEAEILRAQRDALVADAAKWLTDAIALADLPNQSGFVPVPHSQWPQSSPWNFPAFLTQLPSIDANGIGGNKINTPFSTRIAVPLCVFDAPARSQQNNVVLPQSASEEVVNKPKTEPTRVAPENYTPTQQHMLAVLPNESYKKIITVYLGWDNNGVPRDIKQTATAVGQLPVSVGKALSFIRGKLTAENLNLDEMHMSALARAKAPLKAASGTLADSDGLMN